MSDWETSGGSPAVDTEALAEVVQNIRLVDAAKPRDTTAAKEAASRGWVPPSATETYQEPSKSVRETNIELVNQIASDPRLFAGGAVRYEYNGEQGDIGPVNAELEKELFGGEVRIRKGTHFDGLRGIKVIVEGAEQVSPIRRFEDAGLHPAMLQNVVLCKYEVMTPVQCYTFPAILNGYDIIAIAQTGSGKTLGYLAPSLSKLMGKAKKLRGPRGDRVRAEPLLLVVVPTRELCIQIFDEARRLCYRSMLRPCVAYGGGPVREQRDDLRKGADILVATPGRLLDFMRDPEVLSLHRLRFTIIDEADEMLHEDWSEELSEIMSGGGVTQDAQHQYLLFSATFPAALRKLAKQYLQQDYVRIRMGRIGSTVPNIKQQIIWTDGNKKQDALYDLIIAGPACRTLIFVKSKKMVDVIDDFLYHKGMPVTSIHSDRTQLEREDAIRAFRSGKCPILVATGISSRGLDIPNIMHVINYDLPSVDFGGAEEYIHRIGRTGRLGNEGMASSFYNDGDCALAPFLAKILVENGQQVPDFLEEYKPAEGEPLDFEDKSEDEDGEEAAGGNDAVEKDVDGWGAAPVESVKVEPKEEESWGTNNTAGGGNNDW